MYHHPSQLRVANVRRVFGTLLGRGACSRADVARSTGLSPVTAGKVVDGLIAEGLAEEVDAGGVGHAPAMGRPPRWIRLSSRIRLPVLQIGVRECSLRIVRLDESGSADLATNESAEAIDRFATPRSADALVAAIAKGRRRLGIGRAPAVPVSVPGVLRPDGVEILFSPNLRWTRGGELLRRIGREFQSPVCAVQEIQALALGQIAAGEGPESFVLVDFGDGVGGAVVAGGELLRGPQPLCGEIGHTGVFGNRRRCGCGLVGCMETLLSRNGILRSFRAGRRTPRASWAECARHVAERGVERWLAPSIDAAATTIAGAVNLLGTSEIVLTGELPMLHPDVLAVFEAKLREHALIGRFGSLTCRVAPRRRVLGLIAAAADRLLLPEPELSEPSSAVRAPRRPRTAVGSRLAARRR